jgi:integrase
MSRWFGRAFRPSVGINDPTRTFHSFRHLFKDRCRAARLRRDLHDGLTGHADGSAGAGYGDGLALDDLKIGIDALTFPGFVGVPARRGLFVLTSGIGAEIH